jgi:hypothetical protein
VSWRGSVASYQAAGIELTSNFVFVNDVSQIAQSCSAAAQILPAILTPDVFDIGVSTDVERASARTIAIANIAAYMKNGAEKWWRLHGLPTP